METFVIVGAGLAGAKAAQALREEGFDGPLVLIGEENHHPYERPPLSKKYLMDQAGRDAAAVHPGGWYDEHAVRLRLGTAVTALDPAGHEVTLADGERLGYAKLLLATGASPRRLPVPGADLDGVLTLRRFEDSDRIRAALSRSGRIAVVGGGWIGLEVAAAARAAGVEVTVLEAADLPLLRVLGPEAARVFADLHRANGVDLRCGVRIERLTGAGGRVTGVRLADGTEIAADAVVVGIGAAPNTGLAVDAGLDVDDGIRVDAALRTSDPDVYAAGDVANAWHPLLGRHLRVEHWANALHQPQTAAKAMLGQRAAHDRLPYFYTDQYDLGMEYTGFVDPDDRYEVVFRGDVQRREFIAFWLADGRVLAGMNVNVWDVTEPIEALVRSGRAVDPARLADPAVPLADLLSTGD
ncbi:NAD(P)/FAD-dependent oxidoreductase [Rhizomonospora bruguierae]|uniref:NAD(P)/FAD-dependent oxidoreductase n=1 Tax=Rhizomonospora bruguierae TaxID=1581705 RepID=UPI0020C01006|nr:FAD-dependent oxidoreductase [Micromonospora sp. NBRC 107566]